MRHSGNQLPHCGHFLRVHQFRLQHRGIGDIGHDHHHADHLRLLVAHGAEVDRKMSHAAIAAQNPQLKIVHLLPGQGGSQALLKMLAAGRADQSSSGRPSNCFCS